MPLSPGAMRLRDLYAGAPKAAAATISKILLEQRWNIKATAAELGVSEPTLYRFLYKTECAPYIKKARQEFLSSNR